MTPVEIAMILKREGIIQEEKSFLWSAKVMGVDRKLQAGQYLFKGKESLYEVLRKLHSGDVVLKQITFPEGIRSHQIAEILHAKLGISKERFLSLINDSVYIQSLGIQIGHLEGYLHPNTYRFHQESQPEDIIIHMVNQTKIIFSDSLRQRAQQIGFSIHQVLTLASIVEGEAVIPSERPVIAALYHNRLKRNMRLQADPTIQFLIKDGPRRLLNRDLEIESPYNTYLNRGLPPGPVNNPGVASILAVLYPDTVNYVYMVANGDGSHTFSRTLKEHNLAKQRFDQHRRRVRWNR
jgi:UPF0755 protein